MNNKLDISVVVPLYNEAESLPELVAWIDRVAVSHGYAYEVILVDDGSSDGSWEVVESLREKSPAIRGIGFARNYGKSAALYCGFAAAEGEVVITMDADLQDSPDEIPELRRMILEEGYDLVSGWKKKRRDPVGKRWPSKFFNWTARRVSGIKLHDFNCGLKAYRRKVVKSIEVYGEMHRFIPILAKQAGFRRIGEKVVEHHARKYGCSKFGLERTVKGYLDLITVDRMFHVTSGCLDKISFTDIRKGSHQDIIQPIRADIQNGVSIFFVAIFDSFHISAYCRHFLFLLYPPA